MFNLDMSFVGPSDFSLVLSFVSLLVKENYWFHPAFSALLLREIITGVENENDIEK